MRPSSTLQGIALGKRSSRQDPRAQMLERLGISEAKPTPPPPRDEPVAVVTPAAAANDAQPLAVVRPAPEPTFDENLEAIRRQFRQGPKSLPRFVRPERPQPKLRRRRRRADDMAAVRLVIWVMATLVALGVATLLVFASDPRLAQLLQRFG